MATRRHQMIGAAAALVAMAGLVVVVLDDDVSACDRVRDRLAEIAPPSAGPAQRWDDIYLLSEHAPEGIRLRAEHRRLGCRPALPEPTTTTVARPTDRRLPQAVDLGPTFEGRPSRGSIEGPGKTAYCAFAIPRVPRPTDRVDAWFISQEALQEVAVEIVDYPDGSDAREAFAAIVADASCAYEGNEQDGLPVDVHVEGAEQATTLGYTNSNDTHGVAVGVAGRSIVVVWVDVHFGAATIDFVSSVDVLALVVGRVRA